MNKISFTGLLTIQDANSSKLLNTDHVVKVEDKKAEAPKVEITMSKGEPVNFSCTFAEIEKALIEANKNGFYKLDLTENAQHKKEVDKKDTETKTALIEEEPVEAHKPEVKPEFTYEVKLKEGIETDCIFDLFPDELQAEHRCTICPNSYNDFNCYVRNRGYKLDDFDNHYKKLVLTADAAFKKINGLKEDTTFYRALYGDHLPEEIQSAKAGDIIMPDKGFSQVALNESSVANYLPSSDYNPVLFEIVCKKGDRVCQVPHNLTGSGRSEAMMPREAKYKVLSKEKTTYMSYYPSWSTGKIECKPIENVTKYVLEYLSED